MVIAKTIEIAWHDDSAIWSVDVSVHNRVVTASGDKVARVWRCHPNPHSHLSPRPTSTTTPTKPPRPSPRPELTLVTWLCDLRAHATTINIARFAPHGAAIATAADLGEIVIWTIDPRPPEHSSLAAAVADDQTPAERWQRSTTLRGHVQDVLHLSWSADSTRLASASVDNTVMIWDLRNPSRTPVSIRSHSNFVQGVAFDPFDRLVASMGNDRTLRIFTENNTTWHQVAYLASLSPDARLFADDAKFNNMFRRLDWSPDGSVLACPSGLHLPKGQKHLFAVHLFARNNWFSPVVQCGGLTTPPCAVRFSPILYELRPTITNADTTNPSTTPNSIAPKPTPPDANQPVGNGPVSENIPTTITDAQDAFASFTYRMIFAVVCVDLVLFYDTQNLTRPFAVVDGLHCAEHTDVAWSADGLTAFVSSVDGYISTVCFTSSELGTPLTEEATPHWLLRQKVPDPMTHKTTFEHTAPVTVAPKKTPATIATIPIAEQASTMPQISPRSFKRSKVADDACPPMTTQTTGMQRRRIVGGLPPSGPSQTVAVDTPPAPVVDTPNKQIEPAIVNQDQTSSVQVTQPSAPSQEEDVVQQAQLTYTPQPEATSSATVAPTVQRSSPASSQGTSAQSVAVGSSAVLNVAQQATCSAEASHSALRSQTSLPCEVTAGVCAAALNTQAGDETDGKKECKTAVTTAAVKVSASSVSPRSTSKSVTATPKKRSKPGKVQTKFVFKKSGGDRPAVPVVHLDKASGSAAMVAKESGATDVGGQTGRGDVEGGHASERAVACTETEMDSGSAECAKECAKECEGDKDERK